MLNNLKADRAPTQVSEMRMRFATEHTRLRDHISAIEEELDRILGAIPVGSEKFDEHVEPIGDLAQLEWTIRAISGTADRAETIADRLRCV